MVQTALTTPSSTPQAWTVPSDFNPASNTVEIVAPGGSGSARTSASAGGKGGAGGAYAKKVNAPLHGGKTAYYQIAAGGSAVVAWAFPINMVQNSTTPGGTGWNLLAVTATTGQTDSQGGTTASTMTDTASSGGPHEIYVNIPKTASVAVKAWGAVDVKANGKNFCLVTLDASNFSQGGAFVNLTNGSYVSALSGTNITSVDGIVVTALGGGWYRIFVTVSIAASDTGTNFNLTIASANGTTGGDQNYTSGAAANTLLVGRPAGGLGNDEMPYTSTNSSTLVYAVSAPAGPNGTTGAAGTAPSTGGQGDTVRYGGNGGANATGTGGGGGGAAGPNGVGGAASTSTGGSADGGTPAGAAAGSNGTAGTQWTSVGAGSGAGGQTTTGNGLTGGNYGGGGSGSGTATGSTGGAGAGGLLVINYAPMMPTFNRDGYHHFMRI